MLAYVSQLVVQDSLSGKHLTCVLSHIFALDIHTAVTFNWPRSVNCLVIGCAYGEQQTCSGVPRNFVRGGGFNKFSWGQRERGSGGGTP